MTAPPSAADPHEVVLPLLSMFGLLQIVLQICDIIQRRKESTRHIEYVPDIVSDFLRQDAVVALALYLSLVITLFFVLVILRDAWHDWRGSS